MSHFFGTFSRYHWLALAAALGTVAALADNNAANGDARVDKPQATSRGSVSAQVLWQMHQTNLLEIEAGQLAEQKASDAQVKSFGKTLVDDHTENDRKALKLARLDGLRLDEPDLATSQMRQDLDRSKAGIAHLKALNASDFDRHFARMMKEDHQQVISALVAQEKQIANPKVARLVKQTIPVLEKHERIAARLEANQKSPLGE